MPELSQAERDRIFDEITQNVLRVHGTTSHACMYFSGAAALVLNSLPGAYKNFSVIFDRSIMELEIPRPPEPGKFVRYGSRATIPFDKIYGVDHYYCKAEYGGTIVDFSVAQYPQFFEERAVKKFTGWPTPLSEGERYLWRNRNELTPLQNEFYGENTDVGEPGEPHRYVDPHLHELEDICAIAQPFFKYRKLTYYDARKLFNLPDRYRRIDAWE